MKIDKAAITITVDVAEVEAYFAVASWEHLHRGRMFKPVTAEVSVCGGEIGTVTVTGFRVKKGGGLYADSSKIEYWSWSRPNVTEVQPAFVHEVRAVALALYTKATGDQA